MPDPIVAAPLPDPAVLPPPPMVGPPAPGALAPIQGPPLPSSIAPVQGPPAPPIDASALPPQLPLGPSGNSAPAVAPPVAPTGEIKDIAKANVDQQLAARAEGAAQQDVNAGVSAKQGQSADELDKQAEALRVKAEQDARANDEAHRQTEDALSQARDKQIPDFWAGREGKRAEMALYVGLGGIAQGLLGSSTNGAAEIVKNNVDAHFRRAKENLDNLYKYAAARGQNEESLRVNQAHALAGLQAQYGATNMAIATRIESMKMAGQGRIDAAKADALAAQFAEKGNLQILEAKKSYAEINKMNAEAAKAREERKAGGNQAGEAALAKMIEQNASPSDVRAAAAKLGVKGQRVDALETQGRAAAKGGEVDQRRQEVADAKDDARTVRDPDTGQPMGLAPSPRVVDKIAQDIAANRSYVQAVDELAAHIEKFGRILNPYSEEGKLRASIAADVQSKGRAVQGIQASDAGAKLEHDVIGGSGVGIERMSDPAVLRRLAREATSKNEARLRASLAPIKGAGSAQMPGGSSSTAVPAGAITGTLNGKRGYVLNGQFVPL